MVKKGTFDGGRRGARTEEGVERKQHGYCLDWWDVKTTGAGWVDKTSVDGSGGGRNGANGQNSGVIAGSRGCISGPGNQHTDLWAVVRGEG